MNEAERLAQLATSSSYLIPDTRHAIAAELRRLQAEVEALRKALHDISLCSQNSASSLAECGRIARAALAARPGGEHG